MTRASWLQLLGSGSDDSIFGAGWRSVLRQRLREPWFWYIQTAILGVAALHVLVESTGWLHQQHPGATLIHLPVVLYVLPIVAAGLRYGAEGALLSGLWVALLSVPSLVIWHGEGYDWVAELVYVAVVVALGAVVALLVERERSQRSRAESARANAEANARRVSLLHAVTSALIRTVDVDEALQTLLPRICSAVPLQAAAVALCTEAGALSRLVVCNCPSAGEARLADALAQVDLGALAAPVQLGTVLVLPFPEAARSRGALVVDTGADAMEVGEQEVLAGLAAQIALALDNVRLQRAERDRLERYAQAVTRAQEEERRHIARDLHDVATHELLLVGRSLDVLVASADDPALASRLESLRDQAAGVVQFLRRFTRDLRPSVLDHFGLPAALEWLVGNVRERTELDVALEVGGDPRRLEPDSELALFRIVEEALRNIERHAAASHACIRLDFGDELRLVVTDDGVGFRIAEPTMNGGAGGVGLLGVRERAELIGAALDVSSVPGEGTSLRITVPVPAGPT